jgi:predicted small integral membrane protein
MVNLSRAQVIALVLLSAVTSLLVTLALGVWLPIPWQAVGSSLGQFFTDTLNINLAWMDWTQPTAIFFSGLGVALTVMTLWDILSPTRERKGFLPVTTTRGTKFFLSVISFIGIMVLTLAIFPNISLGNLWYAVAIALVWILVMVIWG